MIFFSDQSFRKWLLEPVITTLRELTMNQQELATELKRLQGQNEKARAEIVKKIADLEAAIGNQGNTTPEVDEALAALKASVQADDDMHADPEDPPVDPNTGLPTSRRR